VKLSPLAERLGRDGSAVVAGLLGSTLVAALLYLRWGINGKLSRDESVYAYGGQQLAHGVAPYVSIFDPKGPGATMFAGIFAGIGHLFGRNDLYFIRLGFFLLSLLTVVAIYLLALRLWRSVIAAVVAAVVFASFTGFAEDALSGPDAKTPGIAAVVFCMWLAVRRQWFLSGVAAAIGFVVWQPLGFFAVVVALVALLTSEPGTRGRAFVRVAVGSLLPIAAVAIYFAVAGAWHAFIEAAFVFPLTGVQRGSVSLSERVLRIAGVVHGSYGFSGVLMWLGMAVLIGVAGLRLARARRQWRPAMADPLICVVLFALFTQLLYAFGDFQGYPDVYPLLPFGALGMGGLAAVLVAEARSATVRRVVVSAALGAALVLSAFSWVQFGNDADASSNTLRDERADACAVEVMLGSTGRLWAMGDPTSLVLLHRRNPDRFIYLGSGVDKWRDKHTKGGFDAWTAKITAVNPAVIVVSGWHGSGDRPRMNRWLSQGNYVRRFVGPWLVYLTPAAVNAAQARHIPLQHEPSNYATNRHGHRLAAAPCI
jgi:4-amino-4-deoxy-L-arabinose transferase-like glycosyltransferase